MISYGQLLLMKCFWPNHLLLWLLLLVKRFNFSLILTFVQLNLTGSLILVKLGNLVESKGTLSHIYIIHNWASLTSMSVCTDKVA